MDSGGSRTLARGLMVLRAIAGASDGATVAELSTATSLDRAVLYRLLDTLCAEGFVNRDEPTRRYHLGVALVELGARAGQRLEVRALTAPLMADLMSETNEAVCLAVRDRDDLVVVDRVEPDGHFVRVAYGVGFRHSLLVGAHGHAITAHLPEELVDALKPSHAIRETLAEVRGRGYAVSNGELETGTTGVAAPIIDASGHAIASLGVVAPTPRLADPLALGPRIVEATRQISRLLGAPA